MRSAISGNRIELYTKAIPSFVKGFLLFLIFLPSTAIVLLLTFVILGYLKLTLFSLIGLAVAGFFGYYFWRMYLWNTLGKQVIKAEKDGLTVFTDFGRFTDNRQHLMYDSIEINFSPFRDEFYVFLNDSDNEVRIFEAMQEDEAHKLAQAIFTLIEQNHAQERPA